MKIALVHDHLTQDGGAEKVLDVFRDMWPEAPVYVLFYDQKNLPRYKAADIRESFLAKIPGARRHYQWLLPLMPMATQRYDLSKFDLVISSTSAFAKGIKTGSGTLHISYCHTPTRYLWSDTAEYIENLPHNIIIKKLLPYLLNKLRQWDKKSVDGVDFFLANSVTVKNRIKNFYDRTSTVVYVPVETTEFTPSKKIGDYFLTGSRLVPYKRTDLVIKVFNRLGYPLIIFGDGPSMNDLKKIAKPNITFVGRVTDKKKAELMANAKAFIHPQLEDFGITPVESMAAGRPVIAYAQGGATETVVPGKTGILFPKQTWESLLDAVLNFEECQWDSLAIMNHAAQFSRKNFIKTIQSFIDEKYAEFKKAGSR